jgi:hypothetical protein
MNYYEIVDFVNDLLNKNEEWVERYARYADQIIENKERYEAGRENFHVYSPLSVYTNVSKAKGTLEYDLRFLGQSVATIKVEGKKVLISTRGKEDGNSSYFGYNIELDNKKWTSPEAKDFRKHFEKCIDKKTKSSEHHVENELLTEFKKKKRSEKKLCNIQPVRLSGMFFQMPTPLAASGNKIEYSKSNGGGIDILSRVKHGNNEINLCVMELKDENKVAEPPAKVMKQAVAYAIFIARLLRSKSRNEWYKLFGFSGDVPADLTLDVTIVMPKNADQCENFGKKIRVCANTELKLYSLYFIKDSYDFTGSLKDSMLL